MLTGEFTTCGLGEFLDVQAHAQVPTCDLQTQQPSLYNHPIPFPSGGTKLGAEVTTLSPALPHHPTTPTTTTTTSHIIQPPQQPHPVPNESTHNTHTPPRQQAMPIPVLTTSLCKCWDARVPCKVGHRIEGGRKGDREVEKREREDMKKAGADGEHQPPPLPVTLEHQQGPTPGPCLHPQWTQ